MERFGSIPMSNELKNIGVVGRFAVEMDEGRPARMYGDDALISILGADHVPAGEELFAWWQKRVVEGYLESIESAASIHNDINDIHIEIRYEWKHPKKGVITVRSFGFVNPDYKEGMRTEGLIQDITGLIRLERDGYELLLKKINEDNRTRSVISCLANDYDFVAHINRSTDSIKIYKANELFLKHLKRPVIDFNTGFELLNYFAENLHEEDREMFIRKAGKKNVDTVLKKVETYQIIVRFMIDGEPKFYRFKFASDKTDSDEIVVGVINIDKTIREREKREELRNAVKVANAENNAKTAFLFNMSHDIRTPVNAITGYTAMAKKYVDSPQKVKDCLDKAEIASKGLMRLINQVLDMSRIEAGKVELHMQPVNLVQRFNEVLTTFEVRAKTNNIRLTGVIKNVSTLIVYNDDTRVNQVIMNILGNALKYTRPGGKVTATLEQLPCEEEGFGRYQITVADTGIGMSDDYLERIYDTFSRENNSTISKIEGTGLGMSIVKKLMDVMGGEINIVSEKDKGTTVTLDFKFEICTDDVTEATMEEKTVDSNILSGKRVLLVEDNEMNREIAKSILEEYDLIVDEAEDGCQAVGKVKESGTDAYDVILMDIQMPVMGGFEATEAIRKLNMEQRIPIVAMTANAFEEDRRKALEAGMDDHIAKPIDVDNMITVLTRMVSPKEI
ncbi:MAG: response regulator [Lachnospiraceae bacterium]|nr:response regulator [Lachnospiraceae bacterium]